MVLGLALMGVMAPAMIGKNQDSKSAEGRREHAKRQRGHLLAHCYTNEESPEQRDQLHKARVYLEQDGKIYITKHPSPTMTPFDGQFYPHPNFPPNNMAGLITVTAETPVRARWVYLDTRTNEMRYGGKNESREQICGPFDLIGDVERFLTLEGRQRWLAVKLPEQGRKEKEEADLGITDVKDGVQGLWTLYFDRDEYDLPPGTQWVKLRLEHVPRAGED